MTMLVRAGWWPGPAPTIEKGRVMCSDCHFHSRADVGWEWDRCDHPEADYGSLVRNQRPRCCDMRNSEAQCGKRGRWFTDTKQAHPIDVGIVGGVTHVAIGREKWKVLENNVWQKVNE